MASSTIDDNRRNPFSSRRNARLILPVIIMILVAPPPVIAPAARRDAGNFTIAAEDGYLAHAFVAVSTNAAVGTDQGGRMFWTKINEEFFRRGGKPSRACTSLKTRFSRTLQHDVNKYIGHLQGALREYHCGWVMATLPRLLTTSNAWRVCYISCGCDSSCVVWCVLYHVVLYRRLVVCCIDYADLSCVISSTHFFVNRQKVKAQPCLRDSSTRNAKASMSL